MSYHARSSLLGWLIVRSVPVLNAFRRGYPWHTAFNELSAYPQDSWGRHVHTFLVNRCMEFLPKYEPHDALHVLLGYDATTEGEIRLQAFMAGNSTRSFAGWVLYRLGLILLPECRELMKSDFARGGASEPIDWLSIEGAMRMPLASVRSQWQIADMAFAT
jgi:hypothetical protein